MTACLCHHDNMPVSHNIILPMHHGTPRWQQKLQYMEMPQKHGVIAWQSTSVWLDGAEQKSVSNSESLCNTHWIYPAW